MTLAPVRERSAGLLSVYYWLFGVLAVVACAVFILLHFINAPYGRFYRKGWGPALPGRTAWVLMEMPAAMTMPLMCFASNRMTDPISLLYLCLWESHYIYRAFIFPFRGKGCRRPMPALVAGMGAFFNIWNGFLNGAWLFFLGPQPTVEWLTGIPFWSGLVVFFTGMAINHHSDAVLRDLRSLGDGRYHIPYGGFYRWVSVPSYLGEILEWAGFALLTCSPAAALFVFFTGANLIPRARSTHQWYQRQFKQYPEKRKAIIPYIL